MADFTPIATLIKQQNQMSLGDVINIARGAQAYQQAQQINPLQVQEQQAITNQQQTAANTANINYDLHQKSITAGMAGGLLADPSFNPVKPNVNDIVDKLSSTADNLESMNIDPKYVGQIRQLSDLVKSDPSKAPQAIQILKNGVRQVLDIGTQGGQLNQAPTYVPSGSAQIPVQTSPYQQGTVNPTAPVIQSTITPAQRETVEQGPDKNFYKVIRNDAGQVIGSTLLPGTTAPGGGGMPYFSPGQQEDIAQTQKEVSGIRSAADQAPIQHNINQNILRLSQNTATGPGSQTWKNVLGGLSSVTGIDFNNVNSYQELGKYLEKNAINAMQQMGGPASDARLAASVAANGSTSFNPSALQDVTKFNDAANSALTMYRQGMDNAVGFRNPNYTNAPAFKSAWSKNLDINIFRLQNAIQDGDTEEINKIKNELGPQGMKELAKKRLNLLTLSQTGRLPQ